MTLLGALQAKLFPYELPETTLELLLSEQELEPSGEYAPTKHKELLTKVVINALYQLVTLVKEKDNGSELQYDVDSIWLLIRRYENELKPESLRMVNRDMTHIW